MKNFTISLFEMICKNGRTDFYDLMLTFGYRPQLDKDTALSVLIEISEHSYEEMLQRVLRDCIKVEDLINNFTSFLPRNPKLMEIFKSFDKGLLEYLETLSKLVHIFSIEDEKIKYKDQEKSLEGIANCGRYMSYCFAQSFKRFLRVKNPGLGLNQEQIDRMLKAIQGLETEIPGKKLIEDFKNGQPIVMATGFTKHVFGTVWHYDKKNKTGTLYIANRGSNTDFIGLSKISFDPASLNETVFDQINKIGKTVRSLENYEVVTVDNIEKFWEILETAGIDRKSAQPLIEQLPQQAGTCSHDNIKACIAALGYIEERLDGKSEFDSAKSGYSLYKRFNDFEKHDALKDALKILQEYQLPPELKVDSSIFLKLIEEKIPKEWEIYESYGSLFRQYYAKEKADKNIQQKN